jgi:murein L,D-transpeptidase YafK
MKRAGWQSLLLMSSVLITNGAQAQLTRPKVTIDKSERRLELYARDTLYKSYRIGLGLNPGGTKEKQGDYRTPEGTYYICRKNPNSSFYLSLGLSYPNKQDAERGLRAGLITRRECDRIIRAIQRRECPPWNTKLGGEIFIHGHGSQSDWTWGCVALDNPEMKELYDLLPLGTEVEIRP